MTSITVSDMARRPFAARSRARRYVVASVSVAILASSAVSSANSAGIGPFDLTESYRTWSFYDNTGTYDRFRWTVDNAHGTAITINDAYDGRVIVEMLIPAHFTEYAYPGCYCANRRTALRARSRYGNQYNRYGNLTTGARHDG